MKMASIALINSLSESFTQLRNSFLSSPNQDDPTNLDNTVVTRPRNTDDVTLYSTPPPPSSPPPTTQPPLFSSTPTPSSQNTTSASLFTATQPSSLSSTELPPTQSLVVRLKRLRNIDNSPSTPHYRVVDNNENVDDVGDEHVGEVFLLRQQLEELRSELTALRLQYDIDREEKRALVKENEELRRKLSSPQPPSAPNCESVGATSNSASNRESVRVTSNSTSDREIHGVTSNDGFTSAASKAKKKKKRKQEAAASAAVTSASSAATASATPSTTAGLPTISSASAASDASAATTAPAQATANQQANIQTRNVYILHDSNTKANHNELKSHYANIIKQTNKSKISEDIKFHLHPSYTLEKTLHDIKELNLTSDDHIIITPLTNNARITNSGKHSTTRQTSNKQSEIIQHLTHVKKIPRQHITFLEAPPLLNSPHSDIFPYNLATRDVAYHHGVNFAQTLVGEQHIWHKHNDGRPRDGDGFHVQRRFLHLIHKSIAAAAAYTHPQTVYRLRRPPFGLYGPWASPRGVGMMPMSFPQQNFPRLTNYRDVALSRPLLFRSKT